LDAPDGFSASLMDAASVAAPPPPPADDDDNNAKRQDEIRYGSYSNNNNNNFFFSLTELVQKTTTGLEWPFEITFGFFTVQVEHGWFRPVEKGITLGQRMRVIQRRRRSHALKNTLDGHDSLNEQRLSVLHVDVEETHKGNTL
jgi:hypothetical protein